MDDLVDEYFTTKMMNVSGDALNINVVVNLLLKLNILLHQNTELNILLQQNTKYHTYFTEYINGSEILKKRIKSFFLDKNITCSNCPEDKPIPAVFILGLFNKLKEELEQKITSCQNAKAKYSQYRYGS